MVPVEKAGRDWLFVPILAVCALTITSLVSVLAVHLYKNRRHSYKSNLPEVIDSIEGKQCAVYEVGTSFDSLNTNYNVKF